MLEHLGSDRDRVWPSADWPPMRLEGPLAVGVAGGHGATTYRCTALVPARLIEFTFDELAGRRVDGHHAFELLPRGGGTLIRHTIDIELSSGSPWRYRTFTLSTHDAAIEELLDNLQRSCGHPPDGVPRWPVRVRLARRRRGLPAVHTATR